MVEQEQKIDYSFTVLQDGEWILETDIQFNYFYPARLVEAICPKCQKKRYHFQRFSEVSLPKEYICPEAITAVVGRIYKSKSGASWTTARWLPDGVEDDPSHHGELAFFFSKFSDIRYFEEPKHTSLIDLSSLPGGSWIDHWDRTRVVYTEKPLPPHDFARRVQSLCWDCCEQIIKNASETVIQGNLVLAKVDVNSPELTAVYSKIKNRATNWNKEFFNHQFLKEAAIFRNFCAYDVIYGDSGTLMPDKVLVTSADHEDVILTQGFWIGYHPDPVED
jgi:hypothetical protein